MSNTQLTFENVEHGHKILQAFEAFKQEVESLISTDMSFTNTMLYGNTLSSDLVFTDGSMEPEDTDLSLELTFHPQNEEIMVSLVGGYNYPETIRHMVGYEDMLRENVIKSFSRGMVESYNLAPAPVGYHCGYARYGNNESYIMVRINKNVVHKYIDMLKEYLGEAEAKRVMSNQMKRDKGEYHITVVKPGTLSKARKEAKGSGKHYKDNPYDAMIGEKVFYRAYGLGTVTDGDNTAYYALVNILGFNLDKDVHPHITLGFNAKDVHTTPKHSSTMVR